MLNPEQGGCICVLDLIIIHCMHILKNPTGPDKDMQWLCISQKSQWKLSCLNKQYMWRYLTVFVIRRVSLKATIRYRHSLECQKGIKLTIKCWQKYGVTGTGGISHTLSLLFNTKADLCLVHGLVIICLSISQVTSLLKDKKLRTFKATLFAVAKMQHYTNVHQK